MIETILQSIFLNQWIVLFIVAGLLLAIAETGFRFGRYAVDRDPDAARSHSGSVQGAVLGLMGLLLGFTFAVAVGRSETRRNLAVEEANSIGTTWLRADFLPDPAPVKQLLIRYTRLRLEAAKVADDSVAFDAAVKESEAIHRELWDLARKAATAKPDAVTTSFITSLNETIDLQSSRLAANRNHVPGAVWLLLLAVTGCGAWAGGFASGTLQHRTAFSQFIFPALIGIVITLIADLDRPRNGVINVSQKPMEDLLESVSEMPQ
jgi:hypothetical protein